MLILVVAVFFCQCDRSGEDKKAKVETLRQNAEESKVIMAIGSVSLTNRELKNFIKFQHADVFEQKSNDKLLSRLFDVFCEQQILLYKAEQADIQVSEEEAAEYMEHIRAKRADLAVDAVTVQQALKVQNYLLTRVYKGIEVTDGDVARFYESHLSEFRRTEEIRLFQILAKDREKLLAVRQELLKQPSRFEEVARRESISPDAANGGAMGFFEKGMLPQEMEGVVFSLKVNEISPIVGSPYGFHLFKITQKRKARMLLLAAVKDEIKDKMLSARLADAYQDFITRVKAEVPVRIQHENLYFPYIKSDSGVSENETKNLSDGDPDPGL